MRTLYFCPVVIIIIIIIIIIIVYYATEAAHIIHYTNIQHKTQNFFLP